MSKVDITSRKDIEVLIDAFYDKIKVDDIIGFMFSGVDWKRHLPTMYDFWDNVLFYTGNYTGNPMQKHQIAHQNHPMSISHFKRWLELFNETIEEKYSGPNCNTLKERANNIATIMQLRIIGNENNHSLI